jgi:hypothetical protein
MKRILALAVLGSVLSLAHGQMGTFRTIPETATLAAIRHVEGMDITLDGQPQRLAPGAQVRDEANRLIVPMQIPAGAKVKYQLDDEGLVKQVWILTPAETPPDPPLPQPQSTPQ